MALRRNLPVLILTLLLVELVMILSVGNIIPLKESVLNSTNHKENTEESSFFSSLLALFFHVAHTAFRVFFPTDSLIFNKLWQMMLHVSCGVITYLILVIADACVFLFISPPMGEEYNRFIDAAEAQAFPIPY